MKITEFKTDLAIRSLTLKDSSGPLILSLVQILGPHSYLDSLRW